MTYPSSKFKKVKFFCVDPDATDSSSDEEESDKRPKSKVFAYEAIVKNKVPEQHNTMVFSLIKSSRNKYNYMGVQKVKDRERFFARIIDPVTKTKLRLGMFDTPEEAAKAYTEKRYEFEARQGFNWVSYDLTSPEKENVSTGSVAESVNSSPDGSEIEEDNQADHVSDVEEVERSGAGVPLIRSARNKYNYLGVRKKTDNNFFIVIRDRVTKKRIRFGGFHTPEEAAEAYANKRREIEGKHGFDWVRCDVTSEKEDENVNSSHDALSKEEDEEEAKNGSEFQEHNKVDVSDMKEVEKSAVQLIKSDRNKYNYMCVRRKNGGGITDPVLEKNIQLGSFDTPEEAGKAYAEKWHEIHGAQQELEWAGYDNISSKEEEKEKNESKPEVDNKVPVSDSKEVKEDTRFGYCNGVQVFDENGFMVGEFDKIDDLRIYNEETF